MEKISRLNGKIKSADLVLDYDDKLVLNLEVEGKGWGVVVPSPAFVYHDYSNKTNVCYQEGTVKFFELLKFFDVQRVNELKGKIVTCEFENYNTFRKFIDVIDDEKTFKW